MLKKILSLTLCLCICLGVVFSATSCGSSEETTTTSTDAVPTTLSFLGITSEVTDEENIQMVEDALNDTFMSRYKTKIELTLVTEDEYMDLIEERIEEAEYWQTYDDSIAQYNAYIKKQANKTNTTTDKIFGNWITSGVEISLETLATRLVYVSEQTTVYEDGRVATLYPEATPIDIVMIVDEEMYDTFDGMGLLSQIDANYTSYKTLQKYIYPTYFTELKNLKGSVKAIPNNNMLAESTYLVVNEELADKYGFNIGSFKDYEDLSDFLAKVKANEKVAPFKDVPEALGVFKLFSDDVAVGAYFDPLVGYNPDEGEQYAGFEIKNLFEIPEYVDHLSLMEDYTKAGYFAKEYMANGYAVQVITGDASVYEKYAAEGSGYLVKEIQIPFVLREAIFDGMLAPTTYCDEPERAMEIIEAINTDPEIKNLLQYGIEEYNYIANEETGAVIRLNGSYMMDNALTGNVYMGLIEEGMGDTTWAYVKQTNLASAASPFLIFPVDEAYLQQNLDDILKDAALAEALDDINISFTEYRSATGSTLVAYNNMLKNGYRDYFLKQLIADNKATSDSVDGVFAGSSVSISWYEDAIAEKIINEKYSKIKTLQEIEVLVGNELADGITTYALYEKARQNAQDYLDSIESLRIISRITLFADMSESEYESKYGSLSATELETAVYNYLRDNFIEENNLTEEDYEKLVQDFIAEGFTFTNSTTKVQYSYTWADFEEIKAEAVKFSDAMDKAKAIYMYDLLKEGLTEDVINSKTDIELATLILDTIRMNYYRTKNTSPAEFETMLYDNVILARYGLTYKDLNKLKSADNATYNDYLKRIKKDYKTELLTMYTKAEYNELAESKVLAALIKYYIESYTKAESSLREAMGLSADEYTELYGYAEEYIKCVNKIKTSFVYTLRTMYDQSYIDSLTVEEAEKAVYEAVYNSGFYMNQVAQSIGIELSEYNNFKSQATEYLGYLEKLISLYSDELQERGYNVAEVRAYTPDEVEDIIRDIIREEEFSDYKTIDVVFEEMCKDAIAGLDTTYAEKISVKDYCDKQAKALSDDYLFSALVNYLNADLQAQLEAAKNS